MKYKIAFFIFVIGFLFMGCGSVFAHSPTTVVYEYDDCYYYDCHSVYYGTTVVVPVTSSYTTVYRSGHPYYKRYHKRYYKRYHTRYHKHKTKRYHKHKSKRYKKHKSKRYNKHKRHRKKHRRR